MTIRRLTFSLFLVAFAAAEGAEGVAGDVEQLLEGVARIAAPGAPGSLCVFGDAAFAVVAGGAGGAVRQPVVGATTMGKGRVVAFGHDGYFGAEALAAADTGRLMLNAVRWAARKPPAEAHIAVRRQGGLLAFLRKQGMKAEALDGAEWSAKLAGFNVLCCHSNELGGDARAAVADFLKGGGGLVAADTAWGWLQLHPGRGLLADHPGNRLLAAAGLVWADGMAERTDPAGFAANAAIPALVHAGRALDALNAHSTGKAQLKPEEISQASWTLTHAARSLPPEDMLLLPRLRRLEQAHSSSAVPTPQKPLTMKEPLARVLLTLQVNELRAAPPEQAKAHPAAAAFPGAVPDKAERVTRTLEINTTVPAWHSTGLYAAPGELLAVEVPQAAAGKGLWARIGAHSDTLWHHAAWRRVPDICRRFPLNAPATKAANAFGGLVYVEVPGGCKVGVVPVKIGGAVEAPLYVLGKMDLAAWRETIRQRPAPWAELATSKVIITLPSKNVRTLDEPEDLMKFWDQVLDACAELAAIPLERSRPERYVTDVQISAGYMHSGYPLMTHLDMADVFADKKRLLADAHGGVWGLFHEMGHNHQSGDWTFGGTGEVTVNLFTLYVYDKVLGRAPKSLRNFGPEPRAKTLKTYLATGPDFGKWKSAPFLALLMYIQLQEGFGWDAFKKVFAEYRALPGRQKPRSDDEKRDQWMVRFSRAVGRNLGPFFQAWGVPTSDKARASIADLPAWMPEDFPKAAK
ncbi:MAG TPA: M60 family metallopeptidase [Planctomycetota bacterium]|nr:M60 family metallopeptidase [Planctomycetota bacterium]